MSYSIIFAFPLLFFFSNINIKKSFEAVFYILAIGIVLIASLYSLDSLLPDKDKNYVQYNNLRADFMDTAKGDLDGNMMALALEQAGWSLADYAVFKKIMFLYDDALFNKTTLARFMLHSFYKLDHLEHIKKRTLKYINNFKVYNTIFLISILLIFISKRKHWRSSGSIHKTKIIMINLIFLAAIIALITYRYLPFRISGPLYLLILGTNCLIFNNYGNKSSNGITINTKFNFFNIVLVVLFTTNIFFTFDFTKKFFSKLKESNIIHQQDVLFFNEISTLSKNSEPILIPLVAWNDINLQYAHPFTELRFLKNLKLFPAGWVINTPYYKNIINSLGLKNGNDFLNWTLNKNGVLYLNRKPGLLDSYLNPVDLIENYLTTHITKNMKVSLNPAVRLNTDNYKYTLYNGTTQNN